MTRTLMWLAGGLLLGLIVHIAVVLTLPALAERDAWSKVQALDTLSQVTIFDRIEAGEPNSFDLDPELTYALCHLDLAQGPGVVRGVLPNAFWSVTVYDRTGRAVYGTTNRSGIGEALQLGIFNPAQTRLLAEQQLDVTEGLLIVESALDDIFVLIRLAPPYPELEARYREALGELTCGNA